MKSTMYLFAGGYLVPLATIVDLFIYLLFLNLMEMFVINNKMYGFWL